LGHRCDEILALIDAVLHDSSPIDQTDSSWSRPAVVEIAASRVAA
jgi:hypothetical protein